MKIRENYRVKVQIVNQQAIIQRHLRGGSEEVHHYINTNKPQFFLQNTSCIRNPQVISGRGAHPLPPSP